MEIPSQDLPQPFLRPARLRARLSNLFIRKSNSENLDDVHRPLPPLYRRPVSATFRPNTKSPKLPTAESSSTFKQALKTLIADTIPLIIIYLAIFSVRNLSLHFIKEKNNIRLTSAIGVGNTLLNIVGLAVFMSLNAGLVSRSSQAFGAKNNQLVGFYLHRALIINVLGLIPSCCLLYWSDVLCTVMGFDLETANYIQEYSSYCIPGIFAMMVYNTLSSYLYSCDIFLPSSIALIISTIVFWVLSYFLFTRTALSIVAIAISFNIMQALAAILIFLYIRFKDPVPGSFFWFKSQSFKGLWALFEHEFLVGSMVFLEWIAYEIIYLFAGRLSITELAALTIVYTNYQTLYAVPVSLADTVLAFVGNAMGEGDTKKAKNFIKAGLTLSLITLVGVELFYIFLIRQVTAFYTSDVKTIEKTVEIFNIYLLYFPADFIQIILSSGLRAIGKEKLGSVMFLICYYVISIPISFVLCFYAGLKVMGLVYGPMVGLYCLLFWVIFAYIRINWEKQKKVIEERISHDHKALDEENKVKLHIEERDEDEIVEVASA